MKYKVIITTSGLGSRLGDITKHTNKSLARIGKKPVISYIIEQYPKDVGFIVTLGYKGDHVKDFLDLAYPDMNIEYVYIDNFDGPGSSLVYSLLKTKNTINCPFIFHACDTITENSNFVPDHNWVAGYKGDDSKAYRSLKVNGDKLSSINQKGELYYDLIHVGLVGVNDYEQFFSCLTEIYEDDKSQQSDCDVINSMIKKGYEFKVKEAKEWFDTGNIDGLKNARNFTKDKFDILDKPEESIFIFEDFVIKFFQDKSIVKNRIERAILLGDLVPNIIDFKNNFYKYEYVSGQTLSKTVNEKRFLEFLDWCDSNLWIKQSPEDPGKFKSICKKFYVDKTKKRIQSFLDSNNLKDKKDLINGISVDPIFKMIEFIDFDKLLNSDPYIFHGDMVLDNIVDLGDSFKLIDWRQDFGGQMVFGDVYYDLAKLSHNLILNHDVINNGGYSIDFDDDKISCDILVGYNSFCNRKALESYIASKGYDLDKVNLLTSIVWINMAPLHEYPLNEFLFYFGKYNLHKVLRERYGYR